MCVASSMYKKSSACNTKRDVSCEVVLIIIYLYTTESSSSGIEKVSKTLPSVSLIVIRLGILGSGFGILIFFT